MGEMTTGSNLVKDWYDETIENAMENGEIYKAEYLRLCGVVLGFYDAGHQDILDAIMQLFAHNHVNVFEARSIIHDLIAEIDRRAVIGPIQTSE